MRTGAWRGWVIGLVAMAAIIAVFRFPPIPQDPAYHGFADDRMLFGIPHFWNVASNAAFLVVGVFGWLKADRGAIAGDGLAYRVFCLGIIFVSIGSAYYHLDPSPQSLVWDRLPMTLAFMALFSMVVGDRVSEQLGARLLWPSVLLGVASVTYWYWSEVQGRGDLRPYVIVQFLPMLIIPLLLLLYSGKRMGTVFLWATLCTYALAKVAEYFDPAIFSWLGFWSGHTLKHLLSALAVLWVVLAFVPVRRPGIRPSA